MGTQPVSKSKLRKARDAVFAWIAGEWHRLVLWVQEVEMGVVWAVSGLSLISFIFTSIWYIDPALLTMVLQFQPATCTTVQSSYLIGISNCTWTSCRLGCTAEIFKCWHILVNYTLVSGSRPIPPPWASISSLSLPSSPPTNEKPAKLYPNVKGCGYPPELQCDDFFEEFGLLGSSFPCWVSHMNPEISLTELDLKRLKVEVMYSLLPLGSFILSTLYALCRLGVFSVCNPVRCCPRPPSNEQTRLTPEQLFRYKKALMAKKSQRKQQQEEQETTAAPATADTEQPQPQQQSQEAGGDGRRPGTDRPRFDQGSSGGQRDDSREVDLIQEYRSTISSRLEDKQLAFNSVLSRLEDIQGYNLDDPVVSADDLPNKVPYKSSSKKKMK